MLINSEVGQYLSCDQDAFSLPRVISNNAVAYFALPALKYPSFAKSLGKIIVNDIKTAIEPLDGHKRIFTIFDEFSVFAGEQVLNLVNIGRGKGIHAVFGTQGLADLRKVSPEFESQLLNCANMIICHRLNDNDDAVKISSWIGTTEAYDITAQVDLISNQSILGSANKNREFVVHPESIKSKLKTGEAFLHSRISKFDAVKIIIRLEH